MSAPAESFDTEPHTIEPHINMSELTDSEKIEIMREQLAWLCFHVESALKMVSETPMGKMAISQMMKRARNGK